MLINTHDKTKKKKTKTKKKPRTKARTEKIFRQSNNNIDTSLMSCQGLGNCTINGNILDFGYQLESFASIGDKVYNQDLLVGTILEKNKTSLTLDSVLNAVTGDFLICAKPQSVENNNLLGHIMKVKMTNKSIDKSEVFAINTEIQKSYE